MGEPFRADRYCQKCGHMQYDDQHVRNGSGCSSVPGCLCRRPASRVCEEPWCLHAEQHHIPSDGSGVGNGPMGCTICNDARTPEGRRLHKRKVLHEFRGRSRADDLHDLINRVGAKPTDRATRIRPTLQRMASGGHGTTPAETEAAKKMLERYKSQRQLNLSTDSIRKAIRCSKCGHGETAHNAMTGAGDRVCMDCYDNGQNSTGLERHTFEPTVRNYAGETGHADVTKPGRLSAEQYHAPAAPQRDRTDAINALREKFHGTASSKVGKSRRTER